MPLLTRNAPEGYSLKESRLFGNGRGVTAEFGSYPCPRCQDPCEEFARDRKPFAFDKRCRLGAFRSSRYLTVPLAQTNPITETTIELPALDGYSLGATLYAPSGHGPFSRVALISSGYGIPAALYARFARFLATEGVPALTYDYRGIGGSRPPDLRCFEAVAEDWSEFDCGGAIAFLRSSYPYAELVGIAHSFGTLLIAGAPNIADISRFLFVCAHTGYFRDYLPKYRFPMAVFWHFIMPAITRSLGYFPGRLLHLGEDLPAGVALQWAARRRPDLQPEATATDVRRARSMIARYEKVTGVALAIGFTDDAFATEAGTRRLLSAFPALRAESLRIAPCDVGMTTIGHFGFFRRSAERALWPIALRFLRGESGPAR